MTQLGKILADRTEYERDQETALYPAAEWVRMCPAYPDLKGVTCEGISSFIEEYSSEAIESDDMLLLANPDIVNEKMLPRSLIEEYLHHVVCLDRGEIFDICIELGRRISMLYPGVIKKYLTKGQKDRSRHAVFVTTPRGGYAALSIFAYSNNLEKYQIPSDIEDEPLEPVEVRLEELRAKKSSLEDSILKVSKDIRSTTQPAKNDILQTIRKGFVDSLERVDTQMATLKQPGKVGVDWLEDYSKRITHVFIVDDILASGEQMVIAHRALRERFGRDVTIVPVSIAGRRVSGYTMRYPRATPPVIGLDTVGIDEFSMTRSGVITVRFPWGSPDGTSDLMLHLLYGSRHAGVRRSRRPTGSEDVTL